MTAAAEPLARVRVGEPIEVRNLTIFPLFSEQKPTQSYLTLDEALAKGLAETTEVSEAGAVPELRFRNRGDLPVLLLDGEELTGAKQNRVLNLTILASSQDETIIPVSCIEAGRWSFKSRAFSSTARAQHARGRAMKLMSVSRSLKRTGRAQSDQGQVWAEIGRKSAIMGTVSPTGALSDVFDAHHAEVEDYAAGVAFPKDAQGAAFAVNGKVLGLELFDRADVCCKLIGKLLRSWSLDALEREKDAAPRPAARGDVQALLDRVISLPGERYQAAGVGEHVRLEDEAIVGGALRVDGGLVHTVAYVREIGADLAPAQ